VISSEDVAIEDLVADIPMMTKIEMDTIVTMIATVIETATVIATATATATATAIDVGIGMAVLKIVTEETDMEITVGEEEEEAL